MERWLDCEEYARQNGISGAAARKRAKAGTVKTRREGRRILFLVTGDEAKGGRLPFSDEGEQPTSALATTEVSLGELFAREQGLARERAQQAEAERARLHAMVERREAEVAELRLALERKGRPRWWAVLVLVGASMVLAWTAYQIGRNHDLDQQLQFEKELQILNGRMSRLPPMPLALEGNLSTGSNTLRD